jgi:diguanylate cyclase (GGDEF)-like protein
MAKKKVLIVDDERELVKLLESFLVSHGYETLTASTGEEALETVARTRVDVILLDIMMPRVDGLQVKARLNENSATADIPVIFLSAKAAISDKVKGLGLGADDYITKPFNMEELLARIKAALKRKGHYEDISMTDGITGLHNVVFFKKQLSLFFGMCKRYDKVFSIVMIDIDNFKLLNDKYGHAAGDFILKNFASIARATLRKVDMITRYGGDEFAIIMPTVNEKEAGVAIERLKNNIKNSKLSFKGAREKLAFSISAGIACYDEKFTDESEMFKLADKRLYEDKNRNMAQEKTGGKR